MMGAGLAKAAFAVADALEVREHAPVRVFVFMALTALDTDPQPTFYAGRDALASALAAGRTDNGYRVAERAVSALVSRGLVSVERRGAPGRNTRYLILDGAGQPLAVDTRRSAWGYSKTPHAERLVNNSEHPTLSVRTPDAERPEHPTLSVGLRNREDKEEETRASVPARTCVRHSSWEHSAPCRACAADRRAADAARRRPSTMSEHRADCGTGNHRRLPDGTCMFCEDRDPLAAIA